MVRVKVCGITNFEDAEVSARAGCDALGFIFYKKSPRYITPEKARDIIRQLPARPHIAKIGVFVNAREKTVRRIIKICNLDMLQFHGNESPEFCRRFKGCRVIKAFRVKNKMHLGRVLDYHPFAYLFDTFMEKKIGGTGKAFDWKMVRHINGIKRPVFLSGGLNAQNVRKAIEIARPEWVDVSSGVELRPGKKNGCKVREFIKAAKRVAL